MKSNEPTGRHILSGPLFNFERVERRETARIRDTLSLFRAYFISSLGYAFEASHAASTWVIAVFVLYRVFHALGLQAADSILRKGICTVPAVRGTRFSRRISVVESSHSSLEGFGTGVCYGSRFASAIAVPPVTARGGGGVRVPSNDMPHAFSFRARSASTICLLQLACRQHSVACARHGGLTTDSARICPALGCGAIVLFEH